MTARINRVGQKYGRLTVLEAGPTRKGHLSWLCRCDCGNITMVDSGSLASGHTQSCGHCERYYHMDDTTMKCQLSNGNYFLFSPEDYEAVSKHKWSIGDQGYPHTTFGGRPHKLHKYLMGHDSVIDHINGNPLDNRRENLRPLPSNKENIWNSKKRVTNTSGYKGVTYDKRKRKYMAQIKKDRKHRFLGYFDDPRDAAVAYDNAAFFLFRRIRKTKF